MAPAFLMFLAGILVVFGIYSILSDLYLQDRSRLSQRVDEEFRQKQREIARRSELFKNFGQLQAEDGEPRLSLRERFVAMVEQSGVGLTPLRLLQTCGGIGLSLGMAGLAFRQSWLVGLVAGLVGLVLPLGYVYWKRNARLDKLLMQLPDAFGMIARVVRAGQSMTQALQAVADEFDAPIAAEFSYCYEQQKLGLPPEVALRDLAQRTGLLEIKILVLALLVQQQTGGNLAQLIENLAQVVRDRLHIRAKVRALTGEGRMQAAVLLALPPFMFAVMMVLHRSYAQELLNRPSLIVATVASMALGTLWIRRIINFDF